MVPQRPLPILVRDVVAAVAWEFDVAPSEIVGPSRRQWIFYARSAVVWLARMHLGAGPSKIGRVLGNRNHATIKSAIVRANALRTSSVDYRRLVDRVEVQLFLGWSEEAA